MNVCVYHSTSQLSLPFWCIHIRDQHPLIVKNGFSLLLILLAMIHHPSVIDLATHCFFENIAFTSVFFSHFFSLVFFSGPALGPGYSRAEEWGEAEED